MAYRSRQPIDLSWHEENDGNRADRRELLCELDGLLTQLEELNLRGRAVPTRVLVQLRRRGVPIRPESTPSELIENVFVVQEKFMKQPELPQLPLTLVGLRRRLAS